MESSPSGSGLLQPLKPFFRNVWGGQRGVEEEKEEVFLHFIFHAHFSCTLSVFHHQFLDSLNNTIFISQTQMDILIAAYALTPTLFIELKMKWLRSDEQFDPDDGIEQRILFLSPGIFYK